MLKATTASLGAVQKLINEEFNPSGLSPDKLERRINLALGEGLLSFEPVTRLLRKREGMREEEGK
jgi:hypothetical protein